ncbi:MAG: electron transport complex subunit RsxB [Pseudomonadota bacterium]
MTDYTLVERIDALLPQTQCGQCGYPGCKPYATAIAAGEIEINRCPPGGEKGIRKLAALLGVEFLPFVAGTVLKLKALALIDEHACIGCTLCIQACPVDAITGASKQMHTVIAAECTGCELCVAPCPVDCISMRPLAQMMQPSDTQPPLDASFSSARYAANELTADEQEQVLADLARKRYEFRQLRLEREQRARAHKLALKDNALEAAKPTAAQHRPLP